MDITPCCGAIPAGFTSTNPPLLEPHASRRDTAPTRCRLGRPLCHRSSLRHIRSSVTLEARPASLSSVPLAPTVLSRRQEGQPQRRNVNRDHQDRAYVPAA